MFDRLKSFRLRTMLLLVTAFAFFFAGYLKQQESASLAFDEYCNSLDSAYHAVALHIRDSVSDRDSLPLWCDYDEWMSVVSLDRKTLEQTRSLWENSINSTAKKEHHWMIHRRPITLLTAEPKRIQLPPLPASDSDLQAWWDVNLRSYVRTNQLHHDMNSSLHVGLNMNISNCRTRTRAQSLRFLNLDKILPNETATTQGKNQ